MNVLADHDSFLDEARAALSEGGILTGAACEPYEADVMEARGKAAVVALPASRDEVQRLAQLAYRHRVALVPQGSRTGLVGAAIPDGSGRQVVVSFQRMQRVLSFNAVNRSITVQSGLRLSQLNDFASGHDLHFPIDVGSDPTVGGLVATNAGGSRLLKYGDVRRNVLGVEVVMADAEGTVLEALAPLRKNNTGIDLKQLFIGSGGLGLVTAVSLDLKRCEKSALSLFVAFPDYASAIGTLTVFEGVFGETLSAFEFISAEGLRAVTDAFPKLSSPFPGSGAACFVLVEIASSMPRLRNLLEERAHDTLQSLMTDQRVLDATIGPAARFWRIRDSLPLAAVRDAVPLAFDVSFPRDALVPFLLDVGAWLQREHPGLRRYEFGHFGDGGCHLIVAIPRAAQDAYGPMRQIALRSAVYERVLAHGGSFSAEHGVGPANIAYYRKYKSKSERAMSTALQTMLDPGRVLGRCRYH